MLHSILSHRDSYKTEREKKVTYQEKEKKKTKASQ